MSDRLPASSLLTARTAGLIAAIGVWIFWSGVLVTGTGWIVTVNVLVGGALAAVGAYVGAWPSEGPVPVPSVVAPIAALVLGIVVIALPFVMGVTYQLLVWSNVIAGALVVVLAGVNIYGSVTMTKTAVQA